MLLAIANVFSLTYNSISALISSYGYFAIFALLVLESASLPIPSEVVLPLVGYFSRLGKLNVELSFFAGMLGGLVGIAIDYYIAYFLGKDIFYKHIGLFHIRKESLDAFDDWFKRNGSFTVFIARLLPVVRGLISFPAGFALMPQKKFYAYSLAGTAIWDIALIAFGYYALSVKNIYFVFTAIAAFGVMLYLIYRIATKRMNAK